MTLYVKTTLIETFGKTTTSFPCLNRKICKLNERKWLASLDQKYVLVLLPYCHHEFSHIFPKDVNNIHKFGQKFSVTFFQEFNKV